jgi:hypothetical protein
MDHISQAYIREATRATQRVLDALDGVNAPRPDARREKLFSYSNIAQAIHDLAHLQRLTGANLEIHQELSRGQNAAYSNSMLVPTEALKSRAVTVVGSGDPISALTLPAADAIRPHTVVGGLGATIIPLPHGANFSLPTQTGTATANWLTNETSTVAESDQAFGQVVFTPRTVGVYTEYSRQLRLQAPSVNDIITRDQARVIGRAIDLKAIYGAGSGGEPTGIVNTAGIGSFSAAAATITTLIAAQVALGAALTSSAGFAATLANAGTMRTRQESVSNATSTLWQGSLIAGSCADLPARSSTALTANQLILGSWEFLNIPIYGALEIQVNPFGQANFQKGIIGVRTFITLDVGLTYSAAFSLGTAFT